MSDKQRRNVHFDKNASRIGQEGKLLPGTSQVLKDGSCEKTTFIKPKGRMLRNTPSQDNVELQDCEMKHKEKLTPVKQTWRMLRNTLHKYPTKSQQSKHLEE